MARTPLSSPRPVPERGAAAQLERVCRLVLEAADLLEAFGENPHRVRAYRQGVESLRRHAAQFPQRCADASLTELPGVGRELAAKVAEIATTGNLSRLRELEARIPAEAAALEAIPGVGRKLAVYLAGRLHVRSAAHLRQLAATHMLRTIPWLGPEGEMAVRRGLAAWSEPSARGGEGVA